MTEIHTWTECPDCYRLTEPATMMEGKDGLFRCKDCHDELEDDE